MSLASIAQVAEDAAFSQRVRVAAVIVGIPWDAALVLHVAVDNRDHVSAEDDHGITDAQIIASLEATLQGADPDPEEDAEQGGDGGGAQP